MSNEYKLNENDVISIEIVKSGWFLISHPTFKVSALMKELKRVLPCSAETIRETVVGEGVDCEVLKPGANWQKGKIRVILEFCPEQPTQPSSPLDDLRQQIKEIES